MLTINELLSTELDSRDENWEKNFLSQVLQAHVKVLAPEPRQGPDKWPYLMVETVQADAEDAEPITAVLQWLAGRGIGLVLNPQKLAPDYVFTYGMIWNLRERGAFLSPAPQSSAGPIAIRAGQEVLAGPPSEAYLPTYVRGVIKQFLMDQGIFAPKALMVSFDKVNYDLCFSIESFKSPASSEHAGIAEALSWFLPAHYAVSMVSEKTIPGFSNF